MDERERVSNDEERLNSRVMSYLEREIPPGLLTNCS